MRSKLTKAALVGSLTILVSGACSDVKESGKSTGMKCGAGKCGANMFDSSSALGKKKQNILTQMKENDTRKSCVIDAKTTKELYNCVRDSKSEKLTTQCGANKEATMKCSANKCGSGK